MGVESPNGAGADTAAPGPGRCERAAQCGCAPLPAAHSGPGPGSRGVGYGSSEPGEPNWILLGRCLRTRSSKPQWQLGHCSAKAAFAASSCSGV